MAFYHLPVFNTTFDFWFPGHHPATDPLDGQIKGQLYLNSRELAVSLGANVSVIRISSGDLYTWGPAMVGSNWQFTDAIGNVWTYRCATWDFMHLGFPNEYVALQVTQIAPTGAGPDPAR